MVLVATKTNEPMTNDYRLSTIDLELHNFLASFADTDQLDRGFEQHLDPTDVRLGVGRQVLPAAGLGQRLVPASKGLVHRTAAFQKFHQGGGVANCLAV